MGNEAFKAYAHGSIEENSISFNAFFDIGGQIKTTNNIVSNTDVIWDFLDLGESDLEKIKELCKNYKRVSPTELKMNISMPCPLPDVRMTWIHSVS